MTSVSSKASASNVKKRSTTSTSGTQRLPSIYPGWHDAVAGACAGAGARVLTHPLDLIRIRRQLAPFTNSNGSHAPTAKPALKRPLHPPHQPSLLQSIVLVVRNEGGIQALFRGNMAAVYLWVSYTAVQFYSYHKAQPVFRELLGEHNNAGVAFLAGATAGVAATVSTYPLDLCRTIFAARGAEIEGQAAVAAVGSPRPTTTFRPPATMTEFSRNLFHHRGWKGFFAGSVPTVIQIIPYMGCSFAIYDALTQGDRAVSMSAYAGSIAGAVSKFLVYPMDTVKKRLQAQAFFARHDVIGGQVQERYYRGVWDCICTIRKTEGPWAFYRGLWASVLKTSIAAGLSFAMFRTTKNALESIHDQGGIAQCFLVRTEPELECMVDGCDDDGDLLEATDGTIDSRRQKNQERSIQMYSKRHSTQHFD